MKFSRYLILLVLFSMVELFSQNMNSYLVSISLVDDYSNNKIESLKIPCYYIAEDELITVIDSEKLSELKDIGSSISLLDEFTAGENLFLITSKSKADITSLLLNEKVIYKKQNTVIVKDLSINLQELTLVGLKVVELKGGTSFKNERRVWQSVKIHFGDSLIKPNNFFGKP